MIRMSPSREWNQLSPEVQGLIESCQDSAPVKVSRIASELGIRVLASTLPAGISGEIRPIEGNVGEYIVRVNRHDSTARQRFTVAHEIAHYLLHRDEIGEGVSDDVLYRSGLSDRREAEANRIAADILMPRPLLNSAIRQAQQLGVTDLTAYLAESFGVSEAAMKIRLGLD